MKCPKCHADNPDTKPFCADCGTQLTPSEDAQPSFTKTLETPVEELTRGALFVDRYEIIEELGRGGMGAVYRVEDKKINQEIDPILLASKHKPRNKDSAQFAKFIQKQLQIIDKFQSKHTHIDLLKYQDYFKGQLKSAEKSTRNYFNKF